MPKVAGYHVPLGGGRVLVVVSWKRQSKVLCPLNSGLVKPEPSQVGGMILSLQRLLSRQA